MKYLSQRDAFFNRIYELSKADKDLVIVAADMSAPALDKYRRDFPSQFINVGIAEQNAILIASGLAIEGKKVIAYAISPFITMRCLEQIRVNNGIMKIPITIVGMGVGFSYENDGPTHHLIEDISIMRAIPHVKIHNLTDSVMADAYADITYKTTETHYIRLDKNVYPSIYHSGFDFSGGMARLREGKENYLLSTGCMTHVALELADTLSKWGIDMGVIDVFDIPINESLLLKMTKGVKKLLTLEEHFLPGGLGSHVCEILNDHKRLIPVKRLGLPIDRGYCYKYGGREVIRGYYGIDKESLLRTICEYVEKDR